MMAVQEKLVQVYVGSESLGMHFEGAVGLAIQRDDHEADMMTIQAKELGIKPRKVE